MGRIETAILTLEEARGRFEEWRRNRRGKARIPTELWSAAVEVARKEGINRTARELHVAWDDLKRRVVTAGEVYALRSLSMPRKRKRFAASSGFFREDMGTETRPAYCCSLTTSPATSSVSFSEHTLSRSPPNKFREELLDRGGSAPEAGDVLFSCRGESLPEAASSR